MGVRREGAIRVRGAMRRLTALDAAWSTLADGFARITEKYPHLVPEGESARVHLGTLGTGNHFIEVCLDGEAAWFMLHSGSRGIGNAIGSHFIELAKEDMRQR